MYTYIFSNLSKGVQALGCASYFTAALSILTNTWGKRTALINRLKDGKTSKTCAGFHKDTRPACEICSRLFSVKEGYNCCS